MNESSRNDSDTRTTRSDHGGKARRLDRLPDQCPSWCINEHERALAEGCDIESARVHSTGDLVGIAQATDERVRWNLWLRADPGRDPVFFGGAFVELGTTRPTADGSGHDHHVWRLDTGAARVLARQLLHFADQADLDG